MDGRMPKRILIHGKRKPQIRRVVLLDPQQGLVVLAVHRLHILQVDRLPQHHLVKRTDEESVEQLSMVNGHPGDAADEPEVVEVFLVAHPGERVDLERVVVHGGVFEKAVVRIEHFFGEQEEPFAGQAAVVQAHFLLEFHPELRLEQFYSRYGADYPVGVLQDGLAADFDFEFIRDVCLCLIIFSVFCIS